MSTPSLNVIMNLKALLLLFFSCSFLLAQPTIGMNNTIITTNNIVANIAAVTNSSFFVAKPGCPLTCGNLTVPYPFGIGDGCSVSNYFQINCSSPSLFNPPKPFLGNSSVEVVSISQNQIRVRNSVAVQCYNATWGGFHLDVIGYESLGAVPPYTLSDEDNKFIIVGCDFVGTMVGTYGQTTDDQVSDLRTNYQCSCNHTDIINGSCPGTGCCETAISKGLQVSEIEFSVETKWTSATCGYAFVGETNNLQFRGVSDYMNPSAFRDRILDSIPLVLDFTMGVQSCAEAAQNSSSYLCTGNATCTDSGVGGYICSCDKGYQGNPYLTPGCIDIDECKSSNPYGLILNDCLENAICINTPGSFTCSCKDHYYGDGTSYCIHKSFSVFKFSLGICFGLGVLLLLICSWWLRREVYRRKEAKLKDKFFKRNGGLLLHQQLSSDQGNLETTKLFASKQLEKATDNYNANRILGQGGQGTVYKGILSDGRTVAIKKSKVLDEGKLGQFINEVVILSRINHRNVVKLIGCCLETEVPMLVYEFISNGTLFDYIHDQNEEFPLTWDLRLRIAAEIAGALSYLHSAASIPIYHRDIKSSNILLDEKFRAKVSDFGISRSISVDKTHLTTAVQGTFGYLDPEYFQSSQFTEKSDVYSFGVVLVELLTGKRPILPAESDAGGSLTTYFLLAMEENRLFDILDARIVNEGSQEEILAIAHVAKRCLPLNGRRRPTMKEVVIELDAIRMSNRAFAAVKPSYEDIEYAADDDLTEPQEVASNSTGSFDSTSLYSNSVVSAWHRRNTA